MFSHQLLLVAVTKCTQTNDYMHTYTYSYLYAHMPTQLHVQMHIQLSICTHAHTATCTNAHTAICTHANTATCTNAHTAICTHANTATCTNARTATCFRPNVSYVLTSSTSPLFKPLSPSLCPIPFHPLSTYVSLSSSLFHCLPFFLCPSFLPPNSLSFLHSVLPSPASHPLFHTHRYSLICPRPVYHQTVVHYIQMSWSRRGTSSCDTASWSSTSALPVWPACPGVDRHTPHMEMG